jgi:phosphoglycerate kinase
LEIKTLDDLDLGGKTVLARVDINSPIDPETGEIIDDMRIRAHLPTIKALANSKLVLLAHQSRPGREDFTTLEKHAEVLGQLCKRDVKYTDSVFGSAAKREIEALKKGDILLLENVRFCAEETSKFVTTGTPSQQAKTFMVKRLSSYVDAFVNDAFAVSHRNQPSVVAFPEVLPSCGGRLMESEVFHLEKISEIENEPRVFLMGGAKAKDSVALIGKLMDRNVADEILTSGLVATIFLKADGIKIGKNNKKTLEDRGLLKLVPSAGKLLEKYRDKIKIPVDLAFEDNGSRGEFPVKSHKDVQTLDIGGETISNYKKIIKESQVVVANGPCGVFEREDFAHGTEEILKSIAASNGFSIISGGHLQAMAKRLSIAGDISYKSTGGKATMSFLAGDALPGIEALKK